GAGGSARRDRAAQRPVDLEDAGTMTVARERVAVARVQAIAADREQLARRDVEEVRARGRQLREARDRRIADQRAAEPDQPGDQRVDDRARAATRERPADRVTGGAEDERERRRPGGVERDVAVRGDAGEQ